MKLVSIIIPTFNRANIITKAIESVISQTYHNWELIVVDDDSYDNTSKVMEYYIENPKIQYIRNCYKKGPSGARNFGISKSNGGIIAFLDSDDSWMKHHLEESIYYMNKYEISFIGSKFKVLTNLGLEDCITLKQFKLAIVELEPIKRESVYIFDTTLCEYLIRTHAHFNHTSSLLINRDILDDVGLFDERLRFGEDLDLFHRIVSRYNFGFIREYHTIYTKGDDNIHFKNNYNHTNTKANEVTLAVIDLLRFKYKTYTLICQFDVIRNKAIAKKAVKGRALMLMDHAIKINCKSRPITAFLLLCKAVYIKYSW